MLDGQLGAVFLALKFLEFSDLGIVIAETGWPSKGDAGQVGVDAENAAEYNKKLMEHVTSGIGTPLMPNRTFEAYIFALFNEDLNPGPNCERNFVLFQPDMIPVYSIGILRPTAKSTVPSSPTPEIGLQIQSQHRRGNNGAFPKQELKKRHCKRILITYVGWVWTAGQSKRVEHAIFLIRFELMLPMP